MHLHAPPDLTQRLGYQFELVYSLDDRLAGHQLPSSHLHAALPPSQLSGLQCAFVGAVLLLPTLVAFDVAMNLQRYEQVSQATDFASFKQGLIDAAHDLGFGLISGVMVIERPTPGAKTAYIPIGNTPAEFLAASGDLENVKRDPVHSHIARAHTPLIYDQRLYADAGAGDLWEMQAPFGYRTGIAVSVLMPMYRRFLLGVDREEALPRDPDKLSRMIADLQLLAIHAQDAAGRVLVPDAESSAAPRLTPPAA